MSTKMQEFELFEELKTVNILEKILEKLEALKENHLKCRKHHSWKYEKGMNYDEFTKIAEFDLKSGGKLRIEQELNYNFTFLPLHSWFHYKMYIDLIDSKLNIAVLDLKTINSLIEMTANELAETNLLFCDLVSN